MECSSFGQLIALYREYGYGAFVPQPFSRIPARFLHIRQDRDFQNATVLVDVFFPTRCYRVETDSQRRWRT